MAKSKIIPEPSSAKVPLTNPIRAPKPSYIMRKDPPAAVASVSKYYINISGLKEKDVESIERVVANGGQIVFRDGLVIYAGPVRIVPVIEIASPAPSVFLSNRSKKNAKQNGQILHHHI